MLTGRAVRWANSGLETGRPAELTNTKRPTLMLCSSAKRAAMTPPIDTPCVASVEACGGVFSIPQPVTQPQPQPQPSPAMQPSPCTYEKSERFILAQPQHK